MFAGIGGMELGFEATGQIETKWQVEIDDYANKVLEQHWPSVARWRDVRTFPPRPVKDWKVDIIAGGFPCQDVSLANGNARGLDGERSGLFSEIVRVAGIIRPRAIVLENVAALYFRGLGRVLGALAEIGYDAEWHCVSASSVGAPHQRDRVFIIGWDANGKLADAAGANEPRLNPARCSEGPPVELRGGCGNTKLADADSGGPQRRTEKALRRECGIPVESFRSSTNKRDIRATEPRLGGVADGVSQWLDEPKIERVIPAKANDQRPSRLRCLGNAIVPQVAEVVARRLLEILEGNGVTDDTKQKANS
tara:strand:+ start:134 stop:1060 length:927 start_codon:yes stop_codon:yes gene_type:complete